MMGGSLAFMISNKFQMLSSLIDLITLLVYLQFLNIRWPLNLQALFEGIWAFTLKKFPNFFTLLIPIPES